MIRRATSFVHFKDETTASSTTLVTPGMSQGLKQRQSLNKDDPGFGDSYRSTDPKDTTEPGDATPKASNAPKGTYKQRVSLLRRQSREIMEHVERTCDCYLVVPSVS